MEMKDIKQIEIKVNGKPVMTFIDERGVQRFRASKLINFFMNKALDYNELKIRTLNGIFTEDDRRLVYQNNGYSVCGYMDIFEEDEIENPLWEQSK